MAAGELLPAWSVATTVKVCSPSARPVYAAGLSQPAYSAWSRAHWKPASSSAVNANSASADLLSLGGEAVMVVAGAVVSTVHVRVAALPWLPAASVARTWKVCSPSARPV